MELNATQHGYGQNTYHLVFVPKCRYIYLSYPGIKKLCLKTFYEVAEKYNFTIHALEIQPDHVHLFVDFPPTYSVSKVVQLFKGISAYNEAAHSMGTLYKSQRQESRVMPTSQAHHASVSTFNPPAGTHIDVTTPTISVPTKVKSQSTGTPRLDPHSITKVK